MTEKNGGAKVFEFTHKINSVACFDSLRGKPLSGKYGQVDEVKVVYSLSDAQLYFVNSTMYPLHFDFCQRVLNYSSDLQTFNNLNYSASPHHQFYLSGVDHYLSKNIYTLEFVGEDEISAEQIIVLYEKVKANSFFGDSLKININTDHLLELKKAGKFKNIPTVSAADIFGTQQYQAVVEGISVGYLHKREKHDFGKITAHDIVIINSSPNDLPLCAGVISSQFQTPLSHISVLCHNRHTPLCAYTKAFENDSLNFYEGKLIKLEVKNDTFFISKITEAEAQQYWKKKTDVKPIQLTADLKTHELLDISKVSFSSRNKVGSKAANFGELVKIQKTSKYFLTPEGAFAIPFSFYYEHVQHPKIKILIDELLNDTIIRYNNDSLKTQLKKIRKAIKEEPIDVELLNAVTEKIKSKGDVFTAYRFRSSTNAEDIPGFNGAGLYESHTGTTDDSTKTIADAIREVWASVWIYRAFEERELFGIDHNTVYMGVLCHRNFPDEKANGVAITRNLYRDDFSGFTVNVQFDEVSVVFPPDGITCEQFVCLPASDMNPNDSRVVTEYISFSNVDTTRRVLTNDEAAQLFYALADIKSHYYYLPNFPRPDNYLLFGLDVEFKFDKTGKLYIKQVRPYN